jgi:4-amino-4-deoxy-L-arabinose transferase-like glycosyltransferase
LNSHSSPAPLSVRSARGLVCAAGLALLLPGLGSGRVLTYHEVCFAQPARGMLATGRWLVPEIAGVVFPDKPPLAHWTAALSMAAFGENEFAVRLPFALAGMLIALIVAELAIAVFNPLVGVAAGLVQLTSYYTLMQARLAECDILLALAVAAGLAVFASVEVLVRKRTLWRCLVLHGCAAAAFLAKGPLGLAFIGMPIVAYLMLERRWSAFVGWLHPTALVVSLVGILGWPIAAVWSQPDILEGWKRHNLDRFSGTLEGDATWPVYYLAMIPLLLLPWTPWTVMGWWKNRSAPGLREMRRFTLCWVLPGLLVISAASWRHKHYAIPLLPVLSMWTAVGLVDWVRPFRRAGGVSPLSSLSGSLRSPLATVFGLVIALESFALNVIVPRFDSYAVQTTFARRIAEQVGGETLFVPHIPTGHGVPLALPENQIAFYLPLQVRTLPTKDEVTWILAPARMQSEFAGFEPVDQVDRLRKSMKEGDRLTLFRATSAIAEAESRRAELRR